MYPEMKIILLKKLAFAGILLMNHIPAFRVWVLNSQAFFSRQVTKLAPCHFFNVAKFGHQMFSLFIF